MQLNDSQFPIGSYSHSYGLETYVLHRLIEDAKDTKEYLENYLAGTFYYNDLLAAYLAYKYFIQGDLDGIVALNLRLQAAKSQEELRLASEKLGSRLLSTVDKMEVDLPGKYYACLDLHREKDLAIHHAVAYGLIGASLDIDLHSCLLSFAFNMAQAMVTNAVKTVPISQFDGQKILYQVHSLILDLTMNIENLAPEYYFASYPGVEIASMQHEIVYSRLYMS